MTVILEKISKLILKQRFKYQESIEKSGKMPFIEGALATVQSKDDDHYVVTINDYCADESTGEFRIPHNPEFPEQKPGDALFLVSFGLHDGQGAVQSRCLFGARLANSKDYGGSEIGPVYFDARPEFKPPTPFDEHYISVLESMLYRGDPRPT